MSLLKIDSFVRNNVEDFFNKHFNGELEPKDLFKVLEKEISASSKKISDEILVPNEFTIFLEENNYGRLSSNRVIDALYETAERKVIKDDLFMDGDLKIRLQKDLTLKDDLFKIQSKFSYNSVSENNDQNQTLVLEKKNFDAPLNLPKTHRIAKLTVIDGADKDLTLEISEKPIYIGRREKNDLILTDDKISRLHAYVSYERHRHIFIDSGSLNGSFIEDEKIDRVYLLNGDKILIGETILLYEVI